MNRPVVRLGNFLFHWRNVLFPLFYFLLFVPSPSLFPRLSVAVGAGLAIALAGQLVRVATIGLVYIIRGGRNRRIYAEGLVTTGLFGHCRNPLYLGNVLIIAGLGVLSNSTLFICLLIPLFILFYEAIIRAEENFLEEKFGDGFRAYKRSVNRWWPSLKGMGETFRGMHFNWQRVLIKEYNATYIWTTGAVLLLVKHGYARGGMPWLRARGPEIGLALGLLLAAYLGVRYMKKSGRWKPD
jgi:protein-S-isoprenylcysteine O-methyltransferase Ste14